MGLCVYLTHFNGFHSVVLYSVWLLCCTLSSMGALDHCQVHYLPSKVYRLDLAHPQAHPLPTNTRTLLMLSPSHVSSFRRHLRVYITKD